MATYASRLLSRRQLATGTMEFTLERPAGLEIRAGQFFDIILPRDHQFDDKPDSAHIHGFSFVNAAYEDVLVAATRLREGSVYKQNIMALADGTAVKVIAPFGDFTLHKKAKVPAVFVTGGIGITPALSIIKQACHDNSGHQITLLYANRTRAEAAYISELEQLARAHANLTFVPVYTRESAAETGVESGHIDAAMLRRYVADIEATRYYVCGPEGMVKAMRQLLIESGADEDEIRCEEFEGY